jgi:four helix bundle protein
MPNENKDQIKIKSFTSLFAWQEAHKLTLLIYKILNKFPKYEQFGLCDQIRRSVSSISANLAEGFGRRTENDKVHFYYIARGSLTETQNHLLVARDLKYIDNDIFLKISEQTIITSKLINGLIKSVYNKKA